MAFVSNYVQTAVKDAQTVIPALKEATEKLS